MLKGDGDEEVASDFSEAMDHKNQKFSFRKIGVVGVSAAFVLAVMVVVKGGKQTELQEEEGLPLIDLNSVCSDDGKNCWDTKCCTNPHHKCYTKNHYWAQCMGSCDKTYQDEYDRVRGITDGWKCLHPYEHEATCARDHTNCQTNTECCSKDWVCYVKDEGWSNCNPTCKRGVKANDYDPKDTEGWSCEIHGLTYGPGATLGEGATMEDELNACMTHYCKGLNSASTAAQNATCWSEKCSYYYDEFKKTTTTITITTTMTAVITPPSNDSSNENTTDAPTTTEGAA